MRDPECVHYSECLDDLAKNRVKVMACEGCARYEKINLVEQFLEEGIHTVPKEESMSCKIPGCGAEDTPTRGLCHKHYQQWKRGISDVVEVMGPFTAIRPFKRKPKADQTEPAKLPTRTRRMNPEQLAKGSTIIKRLLDRGAKAAEAREGNGDRAQKLADEHWDYIAGLLGAHVVIEPEFFKQIEFHYKSAMIHGYKHGLEDRAA